MLSYVPGILGSAGSKNAGSPDDSEDMFADRDAFELRGLEMKCGITQRAYGSGYVALGGTKVIAAVRVMFSEARIHSTSVVDVNIAGFGWLNLTCGNAGGSLGGSSSSSSRLPENYYRPAQSGSSSGKSVILAHPKMLQHEGMDAIGARRNFENETKRKSGLLKRRLEESLESAISPESDRDAIILLDVVVLEDDGSLLSCATMAGSLALANAGIARSSAKGIANETVSLIPSCSVGTPSPNVDPIADLDAFEEARLDAGSETLILSEVMNVDLSAPGNFDVAGLKSQVCLCEGNLDQDGLALARTINTKLGELMAKTIRNYERQRNTA